MTRKTSASNGEDPAPFGHGWRFLYGLVLANLAVLILLFYVFTKAFS